VRNAASCHFSVLASTTFNTITSISSHPKAFLINTLLRAQLPVWNLSGTIRGPSYKILLQCQQYFELLRSLLCELSLTSQLDYELNPSQLLEEEISFLRSSDNLNVEMLTGHLTFSNALFTCEGVDKETQGHGYIIILNEQKYHSLDVELQ